MFRGSAAWYTVPRSSHQLRNSTRVSLERCAHTQPQLSQHPTESGRTRPTVRALCPRSEPLGQRASHDSSQSNVDSSTSHLESNRNLKRPAGTYLQAQRKTAMEYVPGQREPMTHPVEIPMTRTLSGPPPMSSKCAHLVRLGLLHACMRSDLNAYACSRALLGVSCSQRRHVRAG